MDLPIADAEGRLEELVTRAQQGESVVLTKDGHSVAQLTPLSDVKSALPPTPEERARRRRVIEEIQESVRQQFAGREMPTSNHDDLYDEFGLPT
jgi:prevent-host-death family protein